MFRRRGVGRGRVFGFQARSPWSILLVNSSCRTSLVTIVVLVLEGEVGAVVKGKAPWGSLVWQNQQMGRWGGLSTPGRRLGGGGTILDRGRLHRVRQR
jgi:hypothetical protein